MKTEPLAPGRARFEDRGSALRVVIPARRHLLMVLFLGVWIAGWFAGESSALQHLLRGPGLVSGFLLFWLIGWTIGGAFAGFALLWMLFGREIITLDGQSLSIRREILGVGRVRRYDLAEVKNLRLAPIPDPPQAPRGQWVGGLIAFDYGAKTIHFCAGVDEAEARTIAERLAQRNPWRR